MKTLKLALVLGAVLTVLISSSYAAPLQYTNVRPTPIGASSDGAAFDLQNLLNAIAGVGTFNATTDQQAAGYWSLGGLFPSTIPVVSFEITANSATMQMGIFSDTNGSDDAAGRTLVDIFLGPAGPGTRATLLFDTGTGALTIGNVAGNPAGAVNAGTFAGVTASGFGFYIDPSGTGTPTWFSLDQLNGGLAQMVAYREAGPNRWTIGFEDIAVRNAQGAPQGDYDYNDFIFQIESIVPVPEPTTLVLLGLGLIGMGVARRVRRK
jgi:hypothetical protein